MSGLRLGSAHSLVCSLPHVHERQQRTRDSWVREEALYHCTAGSVSFIPVPPVPISHRGHSGRPRWMLHMQWVYIPTEELEFRKPQSQIRGFEQTCTTFALEGDVIFLILDGKQSCLVLWGDIVSTSQSFTSILEKIVQNKNCPYLSEKKHAEMRALCRVVSNICNVFFFLILLRCT